MFLDEWPSARRNNARSIGREFLWQRSLNMRMAASLKYLSLGVATASFLLAGAAFAQADLNASLSGVNSRLDRALDSRSAKPGEAVEAKLDSSVKTADGVDLPRGTELLGKVDRVQASEGHGPSSLSLVFTAAQLKDGKQIPVKVTVVSAFPASDGYMASDGQNLVSPAPKTVKSDQRFDQKTGLLGNITMTSSVQGHSSATFRKKDGDIKLAAGTYLQVGIAPSSENSTMNRGA
jgi:hypothetical protein